MSKQFKKYKGDRINATFSISKTTKQDMMKHLGHLNWSRVIDDFLTKLIAEEKAKKNNVPLL